MKIVGVTKCPVGIAYTYLAAEKLKQTGEKLGHEMKIETQGALGMETPLTMEDIQQADYVILAADTAVAGKDRFAGKKVLEISLQATMKHAAGVFNSLAEHAKVMESLLSGSKGAGESVKDGRKVIDQSTFAEERNNHKNNRK